MILKILKLHSPKCSCNFEKFQNHSYLFITNCTRGRAISYTYLIGLLKLCTVNKLSQFVQRASAFLHFPIYISFRKHPYDNMCTADWFKLVFLKLDIMVLQAKRIYLLIIKVNKLFSFFILLFS